MWLVHQKQHMNKLEFWDHNSYDHPPLTAELVAYAERELHVKLPGLLVELLSIMNGGYTKGFAFPMTRKTSWADDHILLTDLKAIVPDKETETALNILDTAYMIREWGLPEKQVLLSGDGHTWITLDYRKSDIPTVRWIDVESNEDIHVADSFDEFINGLVPQENYAVDDEY